MASISVSCKRVWKRISGTLGAPLRAVSTIIGGLDRFKVKLVFTPKPGKSGPM